MESPVKPLPRLNAKAIIWDIDHTLYHADTPLVPGIIYAIISTLRAHGVPEDHLVEDALKATIHEQLKLVGSSYPYFEKTYGISKAVMAKVIDTMPLNEIPVDTRLPNLFAAHPVKHVINTHGSHAWRERVLQHIGIDSHFSAFIHHADHGYQTKALSDVTHLAALAAAGVAAHEVVMVDDTAANLRIPKELGMQTVLIDYNRAGEDKSPADYVVRDAAGVFELLAAA